jgi:hypothetical protein
MLLLSFSSAVNLKAVNIGWVGSDSDISVLAYTPGAANPQAPSLSGNTWSGVTAAGWSVIGNYSNPGTGSESINATGRFSSYWLIGAFNPLAPVNNLTAAGNDAIKLLSVTGVTPPGGDSSVPDGTLASSARSSACSACAGAPTPTLIGAGKSRRIPTAPRGAFRSNRFTSASPDVAAGPTQEFRTGWRAGWR